MSRRLLGTCVALACVGLFLSVLYVKGHPIDPEEHERYATSFERLGALETRLNETVLELRHGTRVSYDPLVETWGELRATLERIERAPRYLPDGDRGAYQREYRDYVELLARKDELTERFKSTNSVLHNSERYFPVAASDLSRSLRAAPNGLAKERARQRLVENVLAYELTPDGAKRKAVRDSVERMRALAADSADRGEANASLDATIAHAERIVDYRDRLDEVIGELSALATLKQLERLRDRYRDGHVRTSLGASRYRALSYVFASLFALAVAYLFLRLREANATLEQRVAARTDELSEKNRALSFSEARSDAILQGSLDSILAIDDDGRIASLNRAALERLGVGREGLPESASAVFQDAIAFDAWLEAHRHREDSDDVENLREMWCIGAGGEPFPAEVALTVSRNVDPRIFICSIRDISERKRIQQMKNEFVSTVSHELRTPLTSIRGSLGLILGGAMGDVPADVQELLEIACRNTERLTRLINDILDLEKIEAGKMEMAPQMLDLCEVIRESIVANEAFAEQHGVHYEVGALPEETRVFADPDRMAQVLTNLLSNAAKFSPDGEPVLVEAERSDGRVRVWVRDRGDGIPEEFQSQIFQKFTQANSADTRRVGGSGLGLSICKAIIDQTGGEIGFETEPGKGTSFYFELPLWAGPDASIEPVPVERAILICEDDADVARLLQMLLRQAGYETQVAASAAEAKRRIQAGGIRAMTLDLGLPDQSGLDLIRELRADPETASLPIIVVSASADAGRSALNGDAVEIVDWIDKPIDERRLLQAVECSRRAADGVPRVLHVEDDPDVRRVVEQVLQGVVQVTAEGTLAAARERLAAEEFDLVILDLGLPDGVGSEVLQDIRGHVPVILFSAQDVQDDLKNEVRASLTKAEASPEQLKQAIVSILEAQRDE